MVEQKVVKEVGKKRWKRRRGGREPEDGRQQKKKKRKNLKARSAVCRGAAHAAASRGSAGGQAELNLDGAAPEITGNAEGASRLLCFEAEYDGRSMPRRATPRWQRCSFAPSDGRR